MSEEAPVEAGSMPEIALESPPLEPESIPIPVTASTESENIPITEPETAIIEEQKEPEEIKIEQPPPKKNHCAR
ncbi:hypothetical protein NQ314_011727 [Rhamnusium bicolor]|uniref:Uncharacterized protein n=1 Tax=Rhamnusium bicolor TaxID=1586634 RepID=A0AAV8XH18_9CUCU|nr:hypothetical protein NQ314_011727 [Rhamnusium bicolor]